MLICVSLLIAADVQATDEKVEESYIEKGEGPVAYTLDIGRGSTYAPQNQKRLETMIDVDSKLKRIQNMFG